MDPEIAHICTLWRQVVAVALAVGLLLAVPGLKGVATTVSQMKPEWLVIAVLLEVLSSASFIVAFLQVFERAPRRLGARVALSEEAVAEGRTRPKSSSLATSCSPPCRQTSTLLGLMSRWTSPAACASCKAPHSWRRKWTAPAVVSGP